MKTRLLLVSLLSLFYLFPKIASAESPYVLPYPGIMPGNRLYIVKEIKNFLDKFWYFGDISQFKYNLSLSDEYLVESKTLFEYKQYVLALKSLEKSSKYYVNADKYIERALENGKDTTDIDNLYKNAGEKHGELLVKLKNEIPESFFWEAENEEGKNLLLHKEIERAIRKLR